MSQPGQQLSPVNQFRNVLEGSMKTEIAKQLPKGIDPDRFIRTTITTVQMNPDLLQANRNSLFASCMQAAKDGLLPDGREATIQIYNTKINNEWVKMAQYMPMVRGLIKKMYEAGCTKVDGVAVYEKDHFVYELGDEPRIEHRPYLGIEDPGGVIAAYAIVKLENGEIKREVMPRRDIDKVREASKASTGPGWSVWYDQFAIKAVLKRIYKQVPGRSDEFESVANSDNEVLGIKFDDPVVSGANAEIADIAPDSPAQRLMDKVKPQAEEPEIAAQSENPEPTEVITGDGEIVDSKPKDSKPKVGEIPGIKKGSDIKTPPPKKTQSNEEFIAALDGPDAPPPAA